MNPFLKVDFATWFFDMPNLVHRCGYFWNIHLDIFCCVLDLLNNFTSPWFCCGEIVKRSPSLSITSFPIMIIVLMSTSSIVQFFAIDDPDVISTWIVPSMLILLFLKHLNSPIDFSGCFIFVFPFNSRCWAVSMFLKLLGLPVSANQ